MRFVHPSNAALFASVLCKSAQRVGQGRPMNDPIGIPILPGLSALAAEYDGYILDVWGVMHQGGPAYPEAIACVRRLREAGKRVVFLSNAPRLAHQVETVLNGKGVDAALYTTPWSRPAMPRGKPSPTARTQLRTASAPATTARAALVRRRDRRSGLCPCRRHRRGGISARHRPRRRLQHGGSPRAGPAGRSHPRPAHDLRQSRPSS